MYSIFDTHIHLFDSRFTESPEKLLESLPRGLFLNVGIDLETSRKAVAQAVGKKSIFAAVGIHPNSAKSWTDSTESELTHLLTSPKVVAIGEIGLDLFRTFSTLEEQKKILRKQFEIASRHRLPVLLHIRDAYSETLEILEDYNLTGLVHCFSGNKSVAERFLKIGFLISFSGNITFKSAAALREVVRSVPLSKILIETDAPYLAPVPHRGKINRPEYISLTLQKIAEIKDLSPETVSQQTTENAKKLFNLKVKT